VEAIQDIVAAVEQPLTAESAAVLESIKPVVFPGGATRSFDDVPSIPFEQLVINTLPYYELDMDFFAVDPSPERMMESIHPAKGRYFYFGRRNGNIAIRFTAIRQPDGRWMAGPVSAGGEQYFKTNFSWLGAELMKSDRQQYYILRRGFYEYVVLYQGGEPVFINITGRFRYNKMQFFEEIARDANEAAVLKAWLEKEGYSSVEEAMKSGRRDIPIWIK
jgi:hypothetical protein